MRGKSLIAALAMLLAACGGDGRTPLVVYSTHGPDLLKAFEARFEAAHPDVDVQWVDMGSQEVLDRVRSERANPQADVWFGAPAETFQQAAEEGLLAPSAPVWSAAVREQSDPEGRFHALYLTPEVIAYNTEAVPAAEAPRDWDEVLDPRWKGKVLIRDPLASGTMRTIFGMVMLRSLDTTGDTAQGAAWLRRLDAQTKEYVLNPTLLYQKLARQEGLLTLWTMPDIELLKAKTGYPIDYVIPASGTPLVVDAVAVVKGAPHAELAKTFVEFIGSEPELFEAARSFYRFPARGDLPADSLPERLRRAREQLKAEPMRWELLRQKGAEWMSYWDEHIRGRG
jgi:iron(III) transport system substrate-binding protein